VNITDTQLTIDCAEPTLTKAPAVKTSTESSQIRILQFMVQFGFGGTERQVVNLVRMLDRARFEPRFGCINRSGSFLDEVEQQQVPIAEYRISRIYNPTTLRQQLRLAQDMKQAQFQISHSYNFYANFFAVPAARLAGVPVVVASIRDTGMDITPAKIRLHKQVCRLADCILVNAEAVRQWLIAQGYAGEKIEVIRNGIDLSRFAHPKNGAGVRTELGLPEHAPLVVVLARLSRQKGIDSFLEAAAAVGRRCPDARFLIVGDKYDVAYKQSLEQRTVQLGLGGRIIFTGYRSDVPELLSQATISVLPSLSGEGLSNTLLESMAAGRPVVATRVGGSSEVIEEQGVGGLLVPPGDPAAMAEAICAVLENRDLARRLGHEAKRRVTEHFSLERMVRATEDLYVTLLEKATRGKAVAHRELARWKH
jgi:glycosyltransferase involved in cell wall biosynthesis